MVGIETNVQSGGMTFQNILVAMRFRVLVLLSWLAFCYLFSLWLKLQMSGSFENFFFHWDAPLWMFLDCLIGASAIILIRQRFRLLQPTSASMTRDFAVLVMLIPPTAFLTTFWDILIIEELFFRKHHNFYHWAWQFLFNIVIQAVVDLSCVVFFYFSTVNQINDRLLAAQLAQSEMQLKILQQKVDPHFLFNNLNVLSALIEKNAPSARNFLDKLSHLYRYILHQQNAKVVGLGDELEFAKNYSYLLEQRFGTAYRFDWQIVQAGIEEQMIIPTALQSLLENAVKHNAGNRKIPVRISISFNGDALMVKNDLVPKLTSANPSGTGLKNLSARYALLTNRPIKILPEETTFTVMLPLLEAEK